LNNSEITIFRREGADIRVVTIAGDPWFIAMDAIAMLDVNRSSLALLDDDERGVHTVDTLGGQQSLTVISESGLYSLILRSRKAEAKTFKKWITREVIPSIRKTGTYGVAAPAEMSRLEILTMAIDSERRALTAEGQVVELAPKAEAWDDFISSDGLILISTAAKQSGYGQNKAYKLLRAGKVLRPDNIPYSTFEQYFELTFHTYEDSQGRERVASTTKLTPAALPWFKKTLDRLSTRHLTAVSA
jgi:anti-repressor protein